MSFPLWLFGYRSLETDGTHAAALLDLCLQANVSFSGFEALENGGVRFRVGLLAGGRLVRACKRTEIPFYTSVGGAPQLFFRIVRRKGLLAGLLLGVFLLVLSQKFVWSVRVSGNQTLTAGEIRRVLANEGLEVGSYLPRLNIGKVETQTLLHAGALSWIAIHMDGTVAEVQVMERAAIPEKSTQPANLIAERDGQIVELELYRGRAMVKAGDPVRAGDLLVSGVYDSQTVGYRFTRAAGNVLARTERAVRVEIPLSYEEKVYGEPIRGEAELRFFKFSWNFLKNSNKELSSCDIIEVTTGKDWLGLHDLPVSASQKIYHPYTVKTVSRNADEALELAYEELEKRLAALSPGMLLLEKHIQTEIGEESLVLECNLICVENIAVQREFEITEP